MRDFNLAALSALVTVFIGDPAAAHHSATYFDTDVEVVHEDVTVVEFKIANPHGILVYVIVDDEGNEEEWNAELPSANFSRRGGVVESLLGPGDTVTVIGSPGLPSRTRERLMRMTRAEFSDGATATFTAIKATYTPAGTE